MSWALLRPLFPSPHWWPSGSLFDFCSHLPLRSWLPSSGWLRIQTLRARSLYSMLRHPCSSLRTSASQGDCLGSSHHAVAPLTAPSLHGLQRVPPQGPQNSDLPLMAHHSQLLVEGHWPVSCWPRACSPPCLQASPGQASPLTLTW